MQVMGCVCYIRNGCLALRHANATIALGGRVTAQLHSL